MQVENFEATVPDVYYHHSADSDSEVENFEATLPDYDYHHSTDSDDELYVYIPKALGVPYELRTPGFLDDKKEFLSFLECCRLKYEYQPTEMKEQDAGKHRRYCNVKFFMYICQSASVSCAAALFEGEACVTADPNQHFPSGKYPLHYAAAEKSYAMVDLLLRHGARTDVETTQAHYDGRFCKGGLLPLNVSLEILRTHKYLSDWNWKPYPPLLKMICIFCLPQMKAPLEICRLLASNMPDADVIKVFNSYCMRGDLIEIAALLMVSRKKIIDTSSGYMSMCKSIAAEIEKLTNEEIKLLLKSKSVVSSRKRIICLENKLFLLGIFEKIGEAIDSYVKTVDSRTTKEKVVDDMKLLFAAGGVPTKPKDTDLGDIDCENAKIKLATEILENMLQSPNQSRPSVVIGSGSYVRDLCQRFTIAQRWAMKGFFSHSAPVFQDGDKYNKFTRNTHRPEHSEPEPTYERYRPKYHSPPTCSVPGHKMVPCHYSVRGYTSLARVVKKLPRYI